MSSELLDEVICSCAWLRLGLQAVAHVSNFMLREPELEPPLVALILMPFILHLLFQPCNLHSNPEGMD